MKVLERDCRCVEVDVWDADTDSESDSSFSSDNNTDDEGKDKSRIGRMTKRFKKKVGLRKPPRSDKPHVPALDAVTVNDTQSPDRRRSMKLEPRVLHGYTATKDVPFRTVCETIRQYAFQKR